MRSRTALVAFVVAVLAIAAVGWYAALATKSPAQLAAESQPPSPSVITAPVELMTIVNDIVTRGTVRYDQQESVLVDSVALESVSPVVTSVPMVGDQFEEGSVLYEVAGRPTFVLQGDLPLFRDVRRGDSGEDVSQLQQALQRLGYYEGEVDGVYGPQTEGALISLYHSRGYSPLEPSQPDEDSYAAARDAHASASDAVRAAEEALHMLALALDDTVDTLATSLARLEEASGGVHPDTGLEPTEDEFDELRDDVALAEQALAESETTHRDGERSRNDALRQRSATQVALNRARAQLSHPAPATEFLFVESLPIRVDSVGVRRGDIAAGEILRVSGAQLAIDSSIAVEDAGFVDVGMQVIIESELSEEEVVGTISAVADRVGTNRVADDRIYVEVLPAARGVEFLDENVKVTIPIAARSTSGEVLAVPLAALITNGAGESLVTVELSPGHTVPVSVVPGLSTAGGMVEVSVIEGDLSAGDQVVVGRRTPP